MKGDPRICVNPRSVTVNEDLFLVGIFDVDKTHSRVRVRTWYEYSMSWCRETLYPRLFDGQSKVIQPPRPLWPW